MSTERGADDAVRVSVSVAVPLDEAFRIFTEEIDHWWRRGLQYRVAGRRRGSLQLEPRLGGRLFESFEGGAGTQLFETGRVTTWEPPSRLSFTWRAANFAAGEATEVDVVFTPTSGGTLVTVTHHGWSAIRPDHPARHQLEVAPFLRMMGMWWAALMSALREHAADQGNAR